MAHLGGFNEGIHWIENSNRTIGRGIDDDGVVHTQNTTLSPSIKAMDVHCAPHSLEDAAQTVKVKLHYAYKVRNIGRVRPRLRFCVLC